MDLRPSPRNRPVTPPTTTGALAAADGESLSFAFDAPVGPGRDSGLLFVVSHGFTGSWRLADNRRIALRLRGWGAVMSWDSRGHGRSGGAMTLGDAPVHDLDDMIGHARELYDGHVVSLGFSMGAATALRHAASRTWTLQRCGAVVSVSAPASWSSLSTPLMRLVDLSVRTDLGRRVLRDAFDTRVYPGLQVAGVGRAAAAAAEVAPVPLLVVHGGRDSFIPVAHGHELAAAAARGARARGVADRTELWVEPDAGHAESGTDDALVDRIAQWALQACQTSQALRAAGRDDTRAWNTEAVRPW